MTEAQIQAEILLRCCAPGVRLFRNSVGEGWHGEVIYRDRDRMTLLHPRRVTFGWHPGSSDLLGWRSRVIGPDDVGETIAQLVCLEVKGPRGSATAEQKRWHETVTLAGAASGIVRSVDEARTVLGLVMA